MQLKTRFFSATIILGFFSCRPVNKQYTLEAIDSFKFDARVNPVDMSKWKRNSFFQKNRIFNDNSVTAISWISEHDSSLIIAQVSSSQKAVISIPLKNVFGHNINSFPDSYTKTASGVDVMYSRINTIKELNDAGRVIRTLTIRPIDSLSRFSTGTFVQLDVIQDRYYLNVITTNKTYPSAVFPSCDQVYRRDGDSLIFSRNSGKYPDNYMTQYIHMNKFFRTFTGNSIIYTFQSSDSIFQYDLNGNLLQRGKLLSNSGHKFVPFDIRRHANTEYIVKYGTFYEHNVNCYYSKEDQLIYLLKQLRRKNKNERIRHVLIAVDDNLSTKYEVFLDNYDEKANFLFFEKKHLYKGSIDSSKIVEYAIRQK